MEIFLTVYLFGFIFTFCVVDTWCKNSTTSFYSNADRCTLLILSIFFWVAIIVVNVSYRIILKYYNLEEK